MERSDPCFPGKWFIPQRLVSAEQDSIVYSGLLDSKEPVRGSGRQKVLLIWYSLSCLRNRNCSFTPEQKIILLQSSFRKISGLRLMLTVRPDC